MLVAVAKEDADNLLAHLKSAGETPTIVGSLCERENGAVTFSGHLNL
jgi:phosphoribosylaminoimidazole (AIR) synthetase